MLSLEDIGQRYFMNITTLIEQVKKNRSLVFDLDDTIYFERDFLFQAYRVIIDKYFSNSGQDPAKVYSQIVSIYENHGRASTIEPILEKYKHSTLTSEKFLVELNNFLPRKLLKPMKWFQDFVNEFNELHIYIITNGNPQRQKNKVDSLDILNPKTVIYANKYRPKPFTDSFFELQKIVNLRDPIYIGDSVIDEAFSKNCSMQFVNVKNLYI